LVYKIENLGLVVNVGVRGSNSVVATEGISICLVEELINLILSGASITRPQLSHKVVVLTVIATAVEHGLTHLLFIVYRC
jgi:hypothetical protein